MNNNKNENVSDMLDHMANELKQLIHNKKIESPYMVGIHTAGVWIARELHKRLQIKENLGELNINYHRDDFNQRGLIKQTKPSALPISLEKRHIVLVDDILFTGRTIRAAMNELFDYGRPASITLVVLIDRGGRELPINADVVGIKNTLGSDKYYKLVDPDNLTLEIRHTNE